MNRSAPTFSMELPTGCCCALADDAVRLPGKTTHTYVAATVDVSQCIKALHLNGDLCTIKVAVPT